MKANSLIAGVLLVLGSWVSLLSADESSKNVSSIVIGSRLEPFVDDFLIDSMAGAALKMHAPVAREMVITPGDVPWESRSAIYGTVIKTDDLYKMYYRSNPSPTKGAYAYAESKDGIHWVKPNLGLHDYNGDKENNVILSGPDGGHSFSPFYDNNPDCPADQSYKALGVRRTPDDKSWTLKAFVSSDGIRWRLLREEAVITEGAFDSQNVAFWSSTEGKYLCYYRTKSGGRTGLRQISRASSHDFVNWEPEGVMSYRRNGGKAPFEQLYINQTQPYFRAPHIYVAAAARFMQGRRAVSSADGAAYDPKANFSDCSDAVFMTSRGGLVYDRTFMEGWIRPGEGLGNWTTRSNYPLLGIVPTGPSEMSLYVFKCYALKSACIQRYSLRLDGFASVNCGYDGGSVVTKPLIFSGDALFINYATSAAGGIRVELQDQQGSVLMGYSINDCEEIIGDGVEREVRWAGGKNLSSLSGKPVRIRFLMKDADLYSIQFKSAHASATAGADRMN